MKKILKSFLALILLNVFVLNANAANNPYPKYEQSVFGGQIINCTWYAWQQAKDNMGVELPLWYNVETWYSKASKAGYSVGKEPRTNSLMVWNYGEGFGGHVSYVTAVNGSSITYNEGGSPMTESGINTDTMTLEEMNSFLVGFIYLDNIPSTPQVPTTPKPEETPKKQPVKEEPKKEEIIKSSNNYLSDLKITSENLEFNKETLEYNVEVENNIEEVTVTSQSEDEKATITGNDTYKLQEGINNIIISVKAEDETIKEYKININRKVKEEVKKETNDEENSIKKEGKRARFSKKTSALISLGIASLTVLLFIIGYLLITKKKK